MSTARIVFITCRIDMAESLARSLVEARVAACVNVIPRIASTYRWQDEVQRDEESLLLVKTTAERYEALREAVLAQHPYELPEIIAVDIAAGHAPYLDWIAASL